MRKIFENRSKLKYVFLLVVCLNSLLFAEFSKKEHIVTDSLTGLQWQDDTETFYIERNWNGAVNYCNALTLDGYTDWRLPNINELMSIVDDSRKDLAIYPVFQSFVYNFYWSSTTSKVDKGDAYYVNFSYGRQGTYYKYYSLNVRCVRAGQ